MFGKLKDRLLCILNVLYKVAQSYYKPYGQSIFLAVYLTHVV